MDRCIGKRRNDRHAREPAGRGEVLDGGFVRSIVFNTPPELCATAFFDPLNLYKHPLAQQVYLSLVFAERLNRIADASRDICRCFDWESEAGQFLACQAEDNLKIHSGILTRTIEFARGPMIYAFVPGLAAVGCK